MAAKPKVFLSYSHDDDDWRQRFEKHLRVAHEHGHYELCIDHMIGPGQAWRKWIERIMHEADVALFLISENSLTSEFILKEEVPELLRRRDNGTLVLVPVLLKPVDYGAVDWLEASQIRPRDARPISRGSEDQIGEDFADIAKEIRLLCRAAATDEEPRSRDTSGGTPGPDAWRMLNRAAQIRRFARFFVQQLGSNGAVRPQVYFAVGEHRDAPNSLVRQLAMKRIPELVGGLERGDGAIVKQYDIKEWPTKGKKRDLRTQLEEGLFAELAPRSTGDRTAVILDRDIPDLAADAAVIIQHNISADKWRKKRTGRLVDWYVNEFWAGLSASQRQYLVFLVTTYPEHAAMRGNGELIPTVELRQWLSEFCDNRANRLPTLLFQEFDTIELEHLVHWFDTYRPSKSKSPEVLARELYDNVPEKDFRAFEQQLRKLCSGINPFT